MLFSFQRIHETKSAQEVYKCDFCPLTFLAKIGRQNHTWSSHGHRATSTYQCVICDKQVTTREGLRYHMRSYHATSERPIYYCDKCEYKTCVKTSLTRHVKRIHDGTKENECYFCGKKFFAFYRLVSHSSKMHTLEK